MMIIDEEDIEFHGDMVLYEEKPFTGIMRGYYRNGVLRMECLLREGFQEGVCKEWHENGQLRFEWYAVRGAAEGKVSKWHENGTIKSIGEHLHGVELSYDEWDENGGLTIHREIDKNSELFKYVSSLLQ